MNGRCLAYVFKYLRRQYFTAPVVYSGNTPINGVQAVYHYQDFITQINLCFQTASAAMIAMFPGAPTPPPYMTFDAITQLCTIWVTSSYLSNVRMFFNSYLYSFFNNFNVISNGFGNLNKKDFEIILSDNKNNFDTITGKYFFTQEYPALYFWNDLRNIVFVSDLEVENEATPTNKANGLTSNVANMDNIETVSIMSYISILTDFQPQNNNGTDFRSYLQYQPTIYRYYNINTTKDIKKLNLQIYFEDKTGVTYPLFIQPGEQVSIKLMFQKKYYSLS